MKTSSKDSYLFFLASLAILLLVGAPAYAQDKTGEVDKIFSFATPETPGCTVGVSQNGKVIVNRAYGLADVEHQARLTPNSIFDIGSTQKQFTAASILLLVADKRISLSDDIHKYLPELPDYGHKITVDHLLTHTSGIREWTGLLPLAPDGTDVLKLIMRQRGLNFAPGDEWAYSSSGYELLKEIVARVSKMSFAEFTRKRLFEPLGMKSSSYVPDILQATGERALGYQKDGAGWKKFMRLGNQRAGGAVATTTGDLLIWNDALTNKRLGAFVSEKMQETTMLNNGRKLTYARGLIVTPYPGGKLISHNGEAYGYSSWLGRLPEHGLSVAVICNFDPVSASALAQRVGDVFLPPVDPNVKAPGPVAVQGVDVSGRAGLYSNGNTAEFLRLAVNNGRLAVPGGPVLVPVSADRFRPQRTSLYFMSQDDFEMTFRSNDEFELKSMEGKVTRYRRVQPYTPTAADVQALVGRYENDEIGAFFDMSAGKDALMGQANNAPGGNFAFTPIDRDTFQLGGVTVHFLREKDGKVFALDYSNPVNRNIRFKRTSTSAAAPAITETPTTKDAPAPRLDNLVGEYELAPGRSITITLENGQLQGQPTGSSKLPLVHISGATFAVGQADSQRTVTFELGADGRATAMVMRQNGNERRLTKVR